MYFVCIMVYTYTLSIRQQQGLRNDMPLLERGDISPFCGRDIPLPSSLIDLLHIHVCQRSHFQGSNIAVRLITGFLLPIHAIAPFPPKGIILPLH